MIIKKSHIWTVKGWSFLWLNLLPISLIVAQEPFAKWTTTELTLNNGIVQRILQLPSPTGNFSTISYKPVSGDFKYFEKNNPEFQFDINNKTYSGTDNWSFVNIQKIVDSKAGQGAAVTLLSQDKQVEITLHYLLYPNLPVIRKNLIIKNLSPDTVSLESIDIEKFNITAYWATTFSWVCHDYGRRRSIGPYDGNIRTCFCLRAHPAMALH